MAKFQEAIKISLYGLGGELDSAVSYSTDEDSIKQTLLKFVSDGIFNDGDVIKITSFETEIE